MSGKKSDDAAPVKQNPLPLFCNRCGHKWSILREGKQLITDERAMLHARCLRCMADPAELSIERAPDHA